MLACAMCDSPCFRCVFPGFKMRIVQSNLITPNAFVFLRSRKRQQFSTDCRRQVKTCTSKFKAKVKVEANANF